VLAHWGGPLMGLERRSERVENNLGFGQCTFC
jgi:hypothetical protein